MAETKDILVDTPRVMIAGTGSHVGVSTFTLGILVALKRADVAVGLAKLGPSLIVTTHHRRVSGRLSHTLDPWMLSRKDIRHSLGRLSVGAEMLVVESVGGLFDKFDAATGRTASDFAYETPAEMAIDLGLPVILVFNASGYGDSVKALVKGFCEMKPSPKILGVVAMCVDDKQHDDRLRRAVQSLDGPRYLGGVRKGEVKLVGEDIQGEGIQGNLSLISRNRLLAVGDLVQRATDLQALKQVMSQAGKFALPNSVFQGKPRCCRIAVADDAAFHLTVQDNLDLMRRSGAEIVAFSPLADLRLPHKVGGLYFPGGYVHLYARDLQANKAILKAIRQFADDGGVIYAEGGATAYLCRNLALSSGESFEMLGILSGVANSVVDEDRYVPPVYCEVVASQENICSRTGEKIRGLRNTRWAVRLDETGRTGGHTGRTGGHKISSCFRLTDRSILIEDPTGSAGSKAEGYSPRPHILVTTAKLHWGSSPAVAKAFVEAASASLPALKARKGS